MSKDLAKAAAHLYKKESELREVTLEIVDITSTDPSQVDGTEAAVALLYPANDLYTQNNETAWNSQIKPLVDTFFDFPRLRYYYQTPDTLAPSVDDYLTDHGFKVSRILSGISGGAIISDDNLLDEGWWQFEFTVQDDSSSFVHYHFLMDVATDPDFADIIISKDSYSIRNWTYEKEKDVFVSMTFSGVASSYVGRKVRYGLITLE